MVCVPTEIFVRLAAHQLRNVQVTTAAMIPAVVKEVPALILNFNALNQSQPV